MATDINKWTGTGRLTRDAELKYLQSGTPVLNFSIASNYSVKEGDSWKESANFFDCVLWGKIGESLNQYLTKGKDVTISGELRQQRWEKDGQNHSKVVINVENLKMHGGANDKPQAASPQSGTAPLANPQDFTDDIPF